MMPIIRHRWLSVYLIFFAFIGFILFLYGFFPIKYHGGSEARWSDLPYNVEEISVDGKSLYVGEKTRVVLMVIDALRYDFVTSEYMPFMAEMIKNSSACLYKAQAEPPTVTMPRIKAMTTGSISNFIDVALNLGSSAVTDDSFLHQAKLNNKEMVFYGDDTWLRLFPDVFTRSDGTTSFYVSDFTVVDSNVTRHLPRELPEPGPPTWDLMVLHYLGLDHIGHLEGPASPRVKPKMKEMDDVVKRIITASDKWNDETVFIMCGDHGMKDSGSHGGASYSETTVPLVITQKKTCSNLHSVNVDQIDIAPTVSFLLGLPLPKGNTGQILPQILGNNKGELISKTALYALYYNTKMNAEALVKTLGEEEAHGKECYRQYLSAVRHHSDWLSNEKLKPASAKMASKLYQSSLNNMAHYLVKSVVEFDMFAIIIGLIIILMTLVAQYLVAIIAYQPRNPDKYPNWHSHKRPHYLLGRIITVIFITLCCAAFFRITCGVSQTSSLLCRLHPVSVSAVAAIIVIMVSNVVIIKDTLSRIGNESNLGSLYLIEIVLVIGTVIQPITYGGTSFIEEEHQTWYYFWITLEFLVLVYTASILVEYIRKKNENATEIQDKSDLARRMRITGKWFLPTWVQLMLVHRALRTLNQTGDKWAFLPDTGDWLNQDNNKYFLTTVTFASLIWTVVLCLNNVKKDTYMLHSIMIVAAGLCIFFYRVTTHAIQVPFISLPELREGSIVYIFWCLLLFMIAFEICLSIYYFTKETKVSMSKNIKQDIGFPSVSYLGENDNAYIAKSRHKYRSADVESTEEENLIDLNSKTKLLQTSDDCTEICSNLMEILSNRTKIIINVTMLTCSLLLRPHNVVLMPALFQTSRAVNKILDYRFGNKGFNMDSEREGSASQNVLTKVILHSWMGAVFFFYQGNSNSLASIDLGSGYVGLEAYDPVLVAAQMGVHTFAGPIVASLLVFADCVQQNKNWDSFQIHLRELLSTFAVLQIYPLAIYVIITVILRYHLFVWTVISPKLLYDCVHYIIISIGIPISVIILCYSVTFQERVFLFFKNCTKRKRDKSLEPKKL